ncbi:hypothetical protein FQN55_002163 [Onygenales sp. PD_40]|nr:hypothetical protein FQN55_002163 [Onygenales sp. PD_40]KAK2773046.1 hypothetical protein FQN52_004731 [Onygenales sp. PD_12]KAK2791194.1 hypothetical protein FQN53_006032 [Emmonsiellopsis sp. PD_33]KAK2798501.1 hypothetical protein FQN51_007655 [Onygenales sp. PD_10]
MASNAKVVSTKLFGVLTLGTRTVKVGYVDQTENWKRTHLSPETQQKFKNTTEKLLPSLKVDTDTVALQETPHESESDNRTHFTAVEIDGEGTVVAKRHFPIN